MQYEQNPAGNRRLVQWRVQWLIEHLSFYIHLIAKPETVVRHIRETRNEKEIENDIHTTDIDTKLFLR